MAEPENAFTGYLIRRAQQAHVAVWQRDVSAEISGPQFGVLRALHDAPGLSQIALCDELDLDRSTIADLVVRLDRRGLISRTRHSTDRRRNALQLTAHGEAELERLRPRVRALDETLTTRLSVAERDDLRRLLQAVIDHH